MLKLFVNNLPDDITEQEFTELFETHGRVRSLRLAQDVFSGKCRGFGSLEMEGHEARAAIAGLNGKALRGNLLKVGQDNRDKAGKKRGRRY